MSAATAQARSGGSGPSASSSGERLAVEQLHDQEGDTVLLSDVVERADVGMIDPGNRPSFTLEAFELGRARVGERLDRLDGDEPIEARIPRAVDFPHAPGIEESQHFVRPDVRTRRDRHGQRLFERADIP